MSEDNFIARWSRRKQQAEREKLGTDATHHPDLRRAPDSAATAADQPTTEENGTVEPAFDPATLPPIDSIVASSDIRAFLQKNVPAELTKAALRRAWTTDPAIRDFIGIAENQWDFTNPTSIPGFGPLEADTNVQELVAQAMGKLQSTPEIAAPTGEGKPPAASEVAVPTAPKAAQIPAATAPAEPEVGDIQGTSATAAPQHSEAFTDSSSRRRKGHGRAMPS